MDSFLIIGAQGATWNYLLGYNKPAHKLQLWEEVAVAAGGAFPESDTSEAPEARVYDFEVTGW